MSEILKTSERFNQSHKFLLPVRGKDGEKTQSAFFLRHVTSLHNGTVCVAVEDCGTHNIYIKEFEPERFEALIGKDFRAMYVNDLLEEKEHDT